jgi:hypothetical protein
VHPDPPFRLDGLAARIRASSNFRFEWRFFERDAAEAWTADAATARRVLDELVAASDRHRFLRDTFDPMYEAAFEIEPLHVHTRLVRARGTFEDTLARAAADRLGAYSLDSAAASPRELEEIRRLFTNPGDYVPFEFEAAPEDDCARCSEHNGHLFTNWFFGVAWDWCFVVLWPGSTLAWVGCLTDTD